MKKLIFLILIGSIITAQPQAFKRPFSPKKIPNSQDIHRMVNDQVMNRATNSLYDQTGRPTVTTDQIWENNEWKNSTKMEYVYAPAKIKAGQFPGLMLINYYLWSNGAWSANGYDEWSYDGQGNLIQILWYLYGIAYGKTTYSGPYINGHSSEMLYQYYDNGQYVNSMRYTYTYDTNGCITDEVWEMWTNGAWEYFYRQQYYYSQVCCPERWVFSYWENNAWVINYMAAFTYAYANCMTDMVPFSEMLAWYLYLCNPTLVLMGPTTDGTNMSSEDWRDEYTYTNCLAMTYLMYYLGVLQSSTVLAYDQLAGKVSSTYDNSNQRLISQVTQNDGVNSTRTWYSYEGLTLSAESDTGIPTDFSLKQNYPNPFNPSTTITFDLSEDSNVKISIYDMTGRMIRELVNQTMTVGSKTINWDGKDESGNPVSGGIYLYNLQTGDYSQTKKMVLMK